MPEGCDLLEQRSDQRDVIMPYHLTATGVLNIAQRGRWRPETNPSTFISPHICLASMTSACISQSVLHELACRSDSSLIDPLLPPTNSSHTRIRSHLKFPTPAALQMAASPDTRSVLDQGVGACGWDEPRVGSRGGQGRIPGSPRTPKIGPGTPQNRPPAGPPENPQKPPKNKTDLESGPMKPAKIYIV